MGAEKYFLELVGKKRDELQKSVDDENYSGDISEIVSEMRAYRTTSTDFSAFVSMEVWVKKKNELKHPIAWLANAKRETQMEIVQKFAMNYLRASKALSIENFIMDALAEVKERMIFDSFMAEINGIFSEGKAREIRRIVEGLVERSSCKFSEVDENRLREIISGNIHSPSQAESAVKVFKSIRDKGMEAKEALAFRFRTNVPYGQNRRPQGRATNMH